MEWYGDEYECKCLYHFFFSELILPYSTSVSTKQNIPKGSDPYSNEKFDLLEGVNRNQ